MDPIEALFAIPGSIVAMFEISDRLSSEQETAAPELKQEIENLRCALLEFSHVYDDVQKWKYVHHLTQTLLYADLKQTFTLLQYRGDDFTKELTNDKRLYLAEIARTSDVTGEIGKLEIINERFQELPACKAVDFRFEEKLSWIDIMLDAFSIAKQSMKDNQFDDCRSNLRKLENFCKKLNYVADCEMKLAVDTLLSDLSRFRDRLNNGES